MARRRTAAIRCRSSSRFAIARAAKLVAKKFKATYSLKTSKNLGWCMNAPKQDDSNDKADLYFDENKNGWASFGRRAALDHRRADGRQGHADGHVTRLRRVRDALFGEITLSEDGSVIQTKTLDDKGNVTADAMQLPEDTNDNHIAQ